MKILLMALVLLALSSIALFASDVIFKNIDGQSYLYNKANNKFEDIAKLQNQFVNIDGIRYNYNNFNKKWDKVNLKMTLNYYCENFNYLDQLLCSLNIKKEELIKIDRFGIISNKCLYYDLPNGNQSGFIFIKNE